MLEGLAVMLEGLAVAVMLDGLAVMLDGLAVMLNLTTTCPRPCGAVYSTMPNAPAHLPSIVIFLPGVSRNPDVDTQSDFERRAVGRQQVCMYGAEQVETTDIMDPPSNPGAQDAVPLRAQQSLSTPTRSSKHPPHDAGAHCSGSTGVLTSFTP